MSFANLAVLIAAAAFALGVVSTYIKGVMAQPFSFALLTMLASTIASLLLAIAAWYDLANQRFFLAFVEFLVGGLIAAVSAYVERNSKPRAQLVAFVTNYLAPNDPGRLLAFGFIVLIGVAAFPWVFSFSVFESAIVSLCFGAAFGLCASLLEFRVKRRAL